MRNDRVYLEDGRVFIGEVFGVPERDQKPIADQIRCLSVLELDDLEEGDYVTLELSSKSDWVYYDEIEIYSSDIPNWKNIYPALRMQAMLDGRLE